MFSTLPSSLKAVWQLIKPYWFGDDKLRGRLLLATIVGLALGQVYVTVLINRWNNAFYNALQNKDLPAFWHQIAWFSALATGFIIIAVYRQYFMQMLQMRWRRWMTAEFQAKWLDGQTYYRLLAIYKSTDNPDQRIADDIDIFTSSTLTLAIGLMSSCVTLVSFVTILWGLSGTLSFKVAGVMVHVPGYMVWVALLYAVVGTWLTHVIGKPLIGLNFNQQKFEADFRFALVRMRENAETIAFYRGEGVEGRALSQRFSYILNNWWAIMLKQKQLTWFTSAYGQIAIIFPILVAAPRYFAGGIQLGGLMQTASAFGYVQGALSWFIDVYGQFATWRAAVNRLTGFKDAMETSHTDARRAKIQVTQAKGDVLEVEKLSLALPDGTVLRKDIGIKLKAGDRLRLEGPSGSGKTTLLRAMAGLWPYGAGQVKLPTGKKVLFIPQRPYLPILPLRDILAYPFAADDYSQAEIEAALQAVQLEALVPMLAIAENWSQRLSLGEQQKIAFARALLSKPDILLMDEATSALDKTAEATLYALLVKSLPKAIIVGVSHRDGHKGETVFAM